MPGRHFYATQSPYTDPGVHATRLDSVPDELAAMRNVTRQLIFHYGIDGDFASNGIEADRINEIDTRYADRMLGRIFELGDQPVAVARPAHQRLVGCCRDFTILFLAIARHRGRPARARFGFATYFNPGWYLDHVMAEVWDPARQRWRLVDPMIADGHLDASDGTAIDPLDVPADRFIDGARGWSACRAGTTDVHRWAVDPDLDVPATKGWRYVRHNLIHDLAALAKNEMLLWDEWGLTGVDGDLTGGQLALLDEVAALTAGGADAGPDRVLSCYDRAELRVPPQVTSYSPAQRQPRRVQLR
jgi:Transglutaminase-like superfamily